MNSLVRKSFIYSVRLLILANLTLSLTVNAQIQLSDSLVAHYALNGNAQDATGNFPGTVVGALTPTTDRFGNNAGAFYFSGTGNDYIVVSHHPKLNFSNSSFSISVWIQRDVPQRNGMFLVKGRDISNGYNVRVGDGETFPAFRINNFGQGIGPNLFSPYPIVDNVWINYIAVYNHPLRTMYLHENGNLVSTNVVNPTNVTNNFPLLIGRHFFNADGTGGFPYPFQGKIDDVRLYERVLRPEELCAIASDDITCYQSEEKLQLDLNFCANAEDASGKNNHGQVVGAQLTQDRFGNNFNAMSLTAPTT